MVLLLSSFFAPSLFGLHGVKEGDTWTVSKATRPLLRSTYGTERRLSREAAIEHFYGTDEEWSVAFRVYSVVRLAPLTAGGKRECE